MSIRVFLLLFLASNIYANNIEVSNISLTAQNTTEDYTLVQFDLSWENSWRLSSGPENYDGAWVFIKFKKSVDWKHATINYVDGTAAADGHTEAIGSTVKTSSDGVGVFVYRNSDGNGDVNFQTIQLRWNYGVDLVQDNDVVDVKVFAIEMVYIPQRINILGCSDEGIDSGHFYTNTAIGSKGVYLVTSEAAINVSPAINDLYYDQPQGSEGDRNGPIPADFPKGYKAFWTMKYELTEGQWISFVNSLQLTARLNRIENMFDVDLGKEVNQEYRRNTILFSEQLFLSSDAPARAVSYLSEDDNAAYLDWSGLRFMTELEYEKMAKGHFSVASMLASGGILSTNVDYIIINDGEENELITNCASNLTNMNYSENHVSGPLRAGIFAASANNPTRLETGGSFYGVMELSGNLFERVISSGSVLGRTFTGNHGDGRLDENGNSNVPNSPQSEVFLRGGSFESSLVLCTVSTRDNQYFTDLNRLDYGTHAVRGGRTAE